MISILTCPFTKLVEPSTIILVDISRAGWADDYKGVQLINHIYRTDKATSSTRRLHMLSDFMSSAKYTDVKRAAEDPSEW